MAQKLSTVIDKLRFESTRWDGILELKLMPGAEHVDALIAYLSDKDWVVRWCVSEKLGEIGDLRALDPLFDTFVDPDPHVRKNTAKAISRYGLRAVPRLIRYYAHPNLDVRQKVHHILMSLGKKALPILERHLVGQNWVVVSRLVDLIWKIGGEESEEVIVRTLQLPDVQKQSVILLGRIKSRRSILYMLKLFDKFSLRRVILQSYKHIGEDICYPFLVKSLASSTNKVVDNSESAILKIGAPMLPYLVAGLKKTTFNREKIVHLIGKIGPESVMADIHELAKERDQVAKMTESLRQQFPPKSRGFFGLFS